MLQKHLLSTAVVDKRSHFTRATSHVYHFPFLAKAIERCSTHKFQENQLRPPLPSLRRPLAPSKASPPSNKSINISAHFISIGYDMTLQVEAHHFCAHQNEEMRQCLIYDSPEADAKLIGLEYIISENLFLTLPDNEKPLWHSHLY
ncbi:Oil body-associated protein-like - like 1 [Theobroma cacao]|nr:Oil body-associated protein-like - like 1 [Theobroma cacao]